MQIWIKGVLDNILKLSFWLNFLFHVKSDCIIFTNTKRKIQKFVLKVKKSSIFVKHADADYNIVILNQNVTIYIMFSLFLYLSKELHKQTSQFSSLG